MARSMRILAQVKYPAHSTTWARSSSQTFAGPEKTFSIGSLSCIAWLRLLTIATCFLTLRNRKFISSMFWVSLKRSSETGSVWRSRM